MMRVLVMIALVLVSFSACAEAPDRSSRPQARPAPDQPETRERKGLFKSLRPLLRSREKKRLAEKGAVCGDAEIQGVAIGKVPGRIAGCGVENAVKIRSVSGVTLSQQAVMDCTTAKTLKSWVEKSVKPALAEQGGGVVRLRVAAHYACRTRNGRRGARISEHGKGRAIDISGFTLRDGSQISVLNHWGGGRFGRILKDMHRSACATFGTVLGPGSDGHHRDHFHFDTARYRSGSYCR